MTKKNGKIRFHRAMTLLELVLAMVMMTIIFAAVLPQFAAIRNSWDSKQGSSEALQNGRVLMDHINRNLSKARRITVVSASTDPNGCIQFIDYNGVTYRYDIASANNYVEYGPVGALSDLAGPVSSLKFACYDACNISTPLSPVTDVNIIRVIKVDVTITNSASMGQAKTFTTWVYLRTNGNTNGLVGCWKLDETSGLVARDSSGSGHDGTLVNMAGNEWTTGQINGALAFGGTDDIVQVANLSNCIDTNYSVCWWAKPSQSALKEMILLGSDYSTHDFEYYQSNANLCVRADAGSSVDITVSNVFVVGQWVHICGVGDANGTRVYVNGSLAGTTSAMKSTTPNYNLNIGAYPTGEYDFNGVMDDICVYNRALSAAEIADMANLLSYRTFREYKAGYFLTEAHVATPPSNAGDLLIAAVATYGDTSSSLLAPSGWTQIDLGAYDGNVTLGVWRKTTGASEPSDNRFTWSGSCQAYGWIMRFTGQDPANPINAKSSNSTTSSTPTSPAVTSTVDGCLILRLGAFNGDDIVVGSPGLPGHIAITMNETCDTNRVVTYAGLSKAKLSTGGTSITVDKPTGTAQGDLMIAAVATDENNWNHLSAPSGWSSIPTWNGPCPGYTVTLGAWYKTAGASEPTNYTFNWTAPEQAYGYIIRLTGSNLSYIGYSFPNYGTSKLPPCPSITPAGPPGMANTMVLRLGAFDNDTIEVNNPGLPGNTPITMDCSNTGAGTVSGGAGYMQLPVMGPTGATNFSLTSSQVYVIATPCIWPNSSYSNTCSGGAGYVRQSAAGSSGTSNFLLGSPKDARMVTIAIAPASTSIHNCCGNPRP